MSGIRVQFQCGKCGRMAETLARYRRDGESEQYWIERVVGRAVHDSHQQCSPGCTSETMAKLRINLPNRDRVGFPPDVNQLIEEEEAAAAYREEQSRLMRSSEAATSGAGPVLSGGSRPKELKPITADPELFGGERQ